MADGEISGHELGRRTAAPRARRYAAFLSYSHADEEIASWLHRRLETYRIPATLAGRRAGRRLGPIFRDRVELSAAHDLGAEIRKALAASDALIVLCSPRAAASRYVAEEIRAFKQLGRGDRTFAVIIDGEPHAAGKPGRQASEECFPRALLYRVDRHGELTAELEFTEPIAADVREGKDGRESGALKLIAGLLNVGLDELVQREKQAERGRRRRTQIAAGVMGMLALGAAGAGIVAWQQQGLAEARRREADQQRGVAQANESRAAQNEALAKINERRANDNFLLAEAKRLEAERAAQEREIQRLLAEGSAQEARDTLHRFFATRAWEKRLQGEPLQAVRYALAGMQLSPKSAEEFAAPIGVIMHEAGETLPVSPDEPVRTARFSPDGARVLTAGPGATARIWDAGNGRLLATFSRPQGQEDVVDASYSRDGKRILARREGGVVDVWDVAGNQLVTTIDVGVEAYSAELSPDGNHILTAGYDQIVSSGDQAAPIRDDASTRVWNADTGKLESRLSSEGSTLARYSPDGRKIVGTLGGAGLIWNVGQRMPVAAIKGHGVVNLGKDPTSPDRRVTTSDAKGVARVRDRFITEVRLQEEGNILAASLSLDGARVLTASMDNTARVWNAANGSEALKLQHFDYVMTAEYSPDGKRILTSSADGSAKVWDAESGQLLFSMRGHLGGVESAAFSASGKLIVTAGVDRTVRLWSGDDGQLLTTYTGHRAAVKTAEISPDGTRILSNGADGARVWIVAQGRLRLRLDGGVTGAAFSPDGAILATIDETGGIGVWNSATGEKMRGFTLPEGSGYSVVVSPDGKRVLAGAGGGLATIWDLTEGRKLVALAGHEDQVNQLSYSPDGKRIATVSSEGPLATHQAGVRLWDAADGRLIAKLDHRTWVKTAVFSADGKRLVTASGDGAAKIWRAADGKLLVTMEGARSEAIFSATFSPDETRVLTAGTAGNAVWDAADGSLLLRVPGWSLTSSFSPDGSRFVTNELQVYDAATGQVVGTLQGHDDEVSAVAYSPNGRRILTAGRDGVTIVWDAADYRQLVMFGGHGDGIRNAKLSGDGKRLLTVSDDHVAQLWDVSRLLQSPNELARDACRSLLTPASRRFSQAEIDADPLLRAEWSADRDVCAVVPGVGMSPSVKGAMTN